MHTIEATLPPVDADPEPHDATLRTRLAAACAEHGEVEITYPDGAPDVATLDGDVLTVRSKP